MQIEGFKRSISELSVMDESAAAAGDDDKSLRMMVTEWTNEKHRLYLKSMEATFINRLHNSIDSLGRSSLRDHSTRVHTGSSSGQFKVLRSGCWEKVNFKKDEAQPNNADEPCARPCALTSNPWIRHFRSSAKQENIQATREENKLEESTRRSKRLGTKSMHFPSWHSQIRGQDSDDNNEEESAQNFVDEDVLREVVEGTSGAKRIKTLVVNKSSNDQVVPKGKCPERQ